MSKILVYGDGLTKADMRRFGVGAGAREARYFDAAEPCDGVVLLTQHGSHIERITSAYTKAGIPIINEAADLPGPLAVVNADGTVTVSTLLGTDTLPDPVDVGGTEIPLADIVRRAFEDSGAPTPEAWNNAPAASRETYIQAALEQMRAVKPANLADPDPEPPPVAPKKRTYTRRAVKPKE